MLKSIREALIFIYTSILTVELGVFLILRSPITISYSYADLHRTRAISHATSFLEGNAVMQRVHVSADVSMHYIGQRRAYQAKTCPLSGPSPFRPCPVPSVHYGIVIRLAGSAPDSLDAFLTSHHAADPV